MRFDWSDAEVVWLPEGQIVDSALRRAMVAMLPSGVGMGYNNVRGQGLVQVSKPGDTRAILTAALSSLGRPDAVKLSDSAAARTVPYARFAEVVTLAPAALTWKLCSTRKKSTCHTCFSSTQCKASKIFAWRALMVKPGGPPRATQRPFCPKRPGAAAVRDHRSAQHAKACCMPYGATEHAEAAAARIQDGQIRRPASGQATGPSAAESFMYKRVCEFR